MTWDELENACRSCERCTLSLSRTNSVIGCGDRSAKLMFVGEAPGEKEDLSGVPFVGAAGKLFDKFLMAVDIDRDDVYIANMLKCRPPKNRDPLPEEEDVCFRFLEEQFRLVKPSIVVCLGRIAAMRLIDPDFKITRDHGIWYDRGDYSISAVYHPSLLLRDPGRREAMLTDMKEIKRRLDALENRDKID